MNTIGLSLVAEFEGTPEISGHFLLRREGCCWPSKWNNSDRAFSDKISKKVNSLADPRRDR
jgi:hypothetical protein